MLLFPFKIKVCMLITFPTHSKLLFRLKLPPALACTDKTHWEINNVESCGLDFILISTKRKPLSAGRELNDGGRHLSFFPQHQHGPECIAQRRCWSVGKRGNRIKQTQAEGVEIRYRTQTRSTNCEKWKWNASMQRKTFEGNRAILQNLLLFSIKLIDQNS